MLATIILDTFKRDEALAIAAALDEICSPDDTYAFSSACIYAFWNVPKQEILYIGLAKDVARRFRQHTGLVQCEDNCCKRKQIESYFSSNERIGYSVIVQSSLCQPTTKEDEEVIAAAIGDDPFNCDVSDIFDAEENIAMAEGMLLELHNQLGDRLPSWNKIGGAQRGRRHLSFFEYFPHLKSMQGELSGKSEQEIEEELAAESPYDLLLNVEGSALSELNARSTLREIANDPTACEHELLLHGVRMLYATRFVSFEQAIGIQEKQNSFAGPRFEEMKKDGYWNKKVNLLGVAKRKT